MKIWVIVADASRTRFFSTSAANGKLVEFEGRVHVSSREKEQDLVSDRVGRVVNSSSGTHTFGHERDATREESERFAREIGGLINQGVSSHHCERIYLLAAPAFLGQLRKNLSPAAKEVIASEQAINLVQTSESAIREHLPDYL